MTSGTVLSCLPSLNPYCVPRTTYRTGTSRLLPSIVWYATGFVNMSWPRPVVISSAPSRVSRMRVAPSIRPLIRRQSAPGSSVKVFSK